MRNADSSADSASVGSTIRDFMYLPTARATARAQHTRASATSAPGLAGREYMFSAFWRSLRYDGENFAFSTDFGAAD